jgi:hypothetical protein
MPAFNIERFEAMVPAQTRLVRGFAPEAVCEIEKGSHGYFCASWVIGDRGARQLFVEQAGWQVTPFDLRVGIYFADSVRATSDPRAMSLALDALLTARTALQALGVVATFTHEYGTRDTTRYGWTDEDLREWLTKASPNRDLVRLWDLQNGEPSDGEINTALTALAPVWLAWNSLD